MSFTILFALLAVLILAIVFFVISWWKGLKIGVIVTGITAIVLAGLLMAAIGIIVSSMPN